MHSKLLVISSMLFLSGCGGMWNVGESEFLCEDVPYGYGCVATPEVYRLTNGNGHNVPPKAVGSTATAAEEPVSNQRTTDLALSMAPQPPFGKSKVPIRTPAKILRVWLAPYEGQQGELYMPGLVFREIQPRTWQVGHKKRSSARHASPLESAK